MSTKQEVARRVDEVIGRVSERLRSCDDAALSAPVGDGEWRLRDVLAHLLFWHEEALRAFRTTIDGTYERRDFTDINKVNADAVARMKEVPGNEVAERLVSTGRQLAVLIREVPEDLWTAKPRLAAWVDAAVLDHYEDHEADLDLALNPA